MKSTYIVFITYFYHASTKAFLISGKLGGTTALSSEGSMTPYQLFFDLVRYYGYNVPSLDGDIDVSELTGEHVNVPRISFIPCTLLTHNLHNIDPLGACSDHGKMLYIQAIQTAGHHLSLGCSQCVSES